MRLEICCTSLLSLRLMHLQLIAHFALNVLHKSAVTNIKESSFAGTMTSNAAPFESVCWVIVVAYPFLLSLIHI